VELRITYALLESSDQFHMNVDANFKRLDNFAVKFINILNAQEEMITSILTKPILGNWKNYL
jgi:hypothetical protein